MNPYEILEGAIDLHIHAGPDIFPRELDEADVVSSAREIGMKAVLFKSHFTTNADRVYMLRTIDSKQHIKTLGRTYPWSKIQLPEIEGISILNSQGELIPEVRKVADLVASYDAILCTGHLTVPEMFALIHEAKDAGVEKILVTHAELDVVSVSKEDQKKMAGLGAYIEHSFTPCTHLRQRLDPRRIAEAIRYVGAKHCIMSSDMGQPVNPLPREGFRMFVKTMLHLGISDSDIDLMIRENTEKLLRI